MQRASNTPSLGEPSVDDLGVRGSVRGESPPVSLERYAALVDSMQLGLYVYHLEDPADDRTLRLVEANRAAERLTGVAASELVGKTIDRCFPKLRERGLPQEFASVARAGKPIQFLDFEYGDDRVVSKAWAFKVVPLPDHHIGVLFEVGDSERALEAEDITQRKRAEAALRESEERFRTLVENAPEAIVVLDTEKGCFVQANENALKLFKCRRQDLERLGPVDLRPAYQPDARSAMEAAGHYIARARRGETPAFEWMHQDLEGNQIPCEVRLVRLSAASPNLIRGSMTDISERKLMEQEHRVLEERLRLAQRMESIGRLAGGVAHDFNNMLTVMSGYVELAMRMVERGGAPDKELAEIQKATRMATGMVKQLLAFSRQQMLRPKIFDLNRLIRKMELLLRPIIGEHIRLVTQLEPDLGPVKADPGQIEQAVMNLAVNARDAMQDGGRLTITTSNRTVDPEPEDGVVKTKPGRYVVLAFSDTGHGMDEATKSQIFEPFFSTKGKGRGTGFGLSTVYGIVKQSGGYIWVESEPGRGTTFEILLPERQDESSAKTRATPAGAKARDAAESAKGSETILLVEDEASVRELASRILEDDGYRVLAAGSAEQAQELWQRHRSSVDLLVTDLVLPGMSGQELADRLRQQRPALPVLAMSGYTETASFRADPLQKGVSFIAKPFSPKAFGNKVRQTLDAVGGARAESFR